MTWSALGHSLTLARWLLPANHAVRRLLEIWSIKCINRTEFDLLKIRALNIWSTVSCAVVSRWAECSSPSNGSSLWELAAKALHFLFLYLKKKIPSDIPGLWTLFFLAINLLLLLSSHPTHDCSQDVRLQANETGMLFWLRALWARLLVHGRQCT